jgi:hypothetical protein
MVAALAGAAPAAENKAAEQLDADKLETQLGRGRGNQLAAEEVKSSKTGIPGSPASGNGISRRYLQRLQLALQKLQTWACSDCFHFSRKRQRPPTCPL